MVEFALVSPLFFLLALGLVVTGVAVTHQIQLTNAVRDVARGLAVCGSAAVQPPSAPSASVDLNVTLPDGSLCRTSGNESIYINKIIHQVDPTATWTVQVVTVASGGAITPVGTTADSSACSSLAATTQAGTTPYQVSVTGSFNQPLFLPLVGNFLGNNGSTTTRTLTATAQAQCDQ